MWHCAALLERNKKTAEALHLKLLRFFKILKIMNQQEQDFTDVRRKEGSQQMPTQLHGRLSSSHEI